MKEKKIILTADDYGACDFIDNGIKDALIKGKINVVSTFVTHQSSEERIKNLLELREELKTNGEYTFNIGLHFSITSGYSLQEKHSSLTRNKTNNNFYFKEAKKYKFRKIDEKDIQEELTIQLKMLDKYLVDVPIDHVSNHHGITYLDLDFFDIYIKTIANYSSIKDKYQRPIPIRSPMSWLKSGLMYLDYDKRFKTPSVQQGIKLGFGKKLFEVTKRKLKKRMKSAKKLNIRFPDCLADTIYGQPYLENLCFLVDQYEENNFSSEFMFHLGKGQDLSETAPHGINPDYFSTREKELDALLQFDLPAYLTKYKIKRIFLNQL